jgi:hypothetical protein
MLYLLPRGVTKLPRLQGEKIRGLREQASECFKRSLSSPLLDLFIPQTIKLLWFFDALALLFDLASSTLTCDHGHLFTQERGRIGCWIGALTSTTPYLPLPFFVPQTKDYSIQVLPENPKPWYMTWHLIKLNLCLLVPLFSSASVGYDGILSSSS